MGPDLFRLVSVLGGGSSLVGGRVQFSSLLWKTDQTKREAFLILNSVWHSFSRDI